MARKIQDPATAAINSSEGDRQGVWFVCNRWNQIIKFDREGTDTYKFPQSKVLVDNPELIEKLREAAARENNPYCIFEVAA